MTLPTTLDLPGAPVVLVEPTVSTSKGREQIWFTAHDEIYQVSCSTVAALCGEIKRRNVNQILVWPVSAGLLGGDWIAQALEGDKVLVSLDDQRLQFQRMRRFFDIAAVVAWALTIGIGYVLYGRRRNAT